MKTWKKLLATPTTAVVIGLISVTMNGCAIPYSPSLPSNSLPPSSQPTTPPQQSSGNQDEIFQKKIVGTWETRRIVDNLLLISEESFYPSNEFSGTATLTNDEGEIIYLRYSGTWRIEDGYLYYKITSSNYPKLMPTGDISANKIINVTDRDYVYIDNDGNQQIDRKK